MSSDIKLVYFDVRGRGEFLRLLLRAAKQPFDDVRVRLSPQWATSQDKTDSPYGQLPYMIYNGKKYGQSLAIGSFLAKKFGFYGSNDEDGMRIDEVCQLSYDMRSYIRAWRLAPDKLKKEEAIAKMRDEAFPRYLGYYETLLKDNDGNGHFVGHKLSLADLIVYDMLDTVVALVGQDAISGFPCLNKLRDNVKNYPALKEYLSKPPAPP